MLFTIANMKTMSVYLIVVVLQLQQCLFLLYLKIAIIMNIVKDFELARGFFKSLLSHVVHNTMVTALKGQ